MPQSFTLNDLRRKFYHVFVEVLKLHVEGVGKMRWMATVPNPKPPEGARLFSLSEWSPGDGRTRFRIEDNQGHEVTANLSLQEMRHPLDGMMLSCELNREGFVAAVKTGPDS